MMAFMNLPLKFLLMMWAGWVNRAQQNVIDYLKEENRILREQVGNKRLRLTNAQRRRLGGGHLNMPALGRNMED